MAVGDTPTGGDPPKRPYRFEGILVAATRFDRAAEADPEEGRDRASTVPDAPAGPAPETTGQPVEQRVQRPRSIEHPEPPGPTDRRGSQGTLPGFEFGAEPAHGSRRWLLMALVALLASTVVLALVDLRPGVEPGEHPVRCAPELLQRELGTVDGTDFLVVDQRCSEGFAFLRLEPAAPGPDPVYVAAEHDGGSWRALHHGWVRDCEAVDVAAGGEFPLELCEAMGP